MKTLSSIFMLPSPCLPKKLQPSDKVCVYYGIVFMNTSYDMMFVFHFHFKQIFVGYHYWPEFSVKDLL